MLLTRTGVLCASTEKVTPTKKGQRHCFLILGVLGSLQPVLLYIEAWRTGFQSGWMTSHVYTMEDLAGLGAGWPESKPMGDQVCLAWVQAGLGLRPMGGLVFRPQGWNMDPRYRARTTMFIPTGGEWIHHSYIPSLRFTPNWVIHMWGHCCLDVFIPQLLLCKIEWYISQILKRLWTLIFGFIKVDSIFSSNQKLGQSNKMCSARYCH